ncbi:MAG: hypothetical protein KatS3mg117_3025 [Geminicoccaceae bacterium]|nr:MAG: hypothetical protein KatS3mg117_3025 [Geminicoccaceae bacterium]
MKATATAHRVGRRPRTRCSVASRRLCGRAPVDPPRSVADRLVRRRSGRPPHAASEHGTGAAPAPVGSCREGRRDDAARRPRQRLPPPLRAPPVRRSADRSASKRRRPSRSTIRASAVRSSRARHRRRPCRGREPLRGPSRRPIASADPGGSAPAPSSRPRPGRARTVVSAHPTGPAALLKSGARVKAVAASSYVDRSPRDRPAPPAAAETALARSRSEDSGPDGSARDGPNSPLEGDAMRLGRKPPRARHATSAGLSAPRTPSSDRRPGRSP